MTRRSIEVRQSLNPESMPINSTEPDSIACGSAAKPEEGKLKVLVAVATRQRPEMLSRLLDSLAALEAVPGVHAEFLVVENGPKGESEDILRRWATALDGAKLRYVHEPKIGIPFARNRAAQAAIESGADLLAFIDDDELAAPDWLARLIAGYRRSGARLIGGPVLAAPPPDGLDWIGRMVYVGAAARYVRKAQKAAQRAGEKDGTRVTVTTGNWLGEVSLFSEDNIWFDETMKFTGGSDSRFFWDVTARGIQTAWVADAIAYEMIPKERLSLSYQYQRGRAQSNTHFLRKLEVSKTAILGLFISIPVRFIFVLGMAASLPFNRGARLLDIARSLGWISGRLGALFGQRSSLYQNITGS